MYHRFPKNKSVRDIWLQKCGRGGKWNWESCFICSVHFRNDDYVRDLQAELLGIARRKLLNENAVPSLFLPNEHVKEEDKSDGEEERLRKKYVQEILSNTHTTAASKDNEVIVTETKTGNQATTYLELIRLQSNNMEKMREKLELENKNLRQELENKNSLLMQYEKGIAKLKKEQEKEIKRSVEAEVKRILAQCFTESQINILLNNKKSSHWTDEDISRAFILYCYSKRAYEYLRNNLNIPLPSISSLQRWESSTNKQPQDCTQD
ncbi:hypothetical protein ILUMI_02400 [Ignelater luminosus]|uniref:THAP-type domain-containing protein n=1 Tax=Ignelater luminosus TaxID=2038154 RepID=A0A8K0DCT0_IGNLU|nr:hypothetical protein ILUMI_02400 [Ignelater luminosus]